MKREVKGVAIVCDCCGELYRDIDGLVCYIGDDDGTQIWNDADNHEWLEFGDRHYCPDCYSFYHKDDKYIVKTKDGHNYDWETEEELKGD